MKIAEHILGARNDNVKKLLELCRRGVSAPGPTVLLEVGPCCTMSVVESDRVALETVKVNTLGTKELKGLLEESPQTGQSTMNSLAGVVSLRFEHARETLGHVLSLTVQCYNRVPLSGVDVPPEEHCRNEWRGS